MSQERVFPWGRNDPTVAQRAVVALIIGLAAAAMHYIRPGPSGPSDFTALWHGAKLLLAGNDPYSMIGPGKTINLPSPLYYPAPALVAVVPLTMLPQEVASAAFVFLSSALLAFGATRDGWQLLPIFPSVAFMTSARLGQWSIIMTAVLFLPPLAFLAAAKPQASLPVLASATKRSTWLAALAGGFVLIAVSLILFPAWPLAWWSLLGKSEYFSPPLFTLRGLPIALVLIRWRRPEAWLVLIAACLPQTWYPYNGLILLAIARTFMEASLLSLTASVGGLAAYAFLPGEWRSQERRLAFQSILIAFSYLPATIAVLRRPNVGPGPLWIRYFARSDR